MGEMKPIYDIRVIESAKKLAPFLWNEPLTIGYFYKMSNALLSHADIKKGLDYLVEVGFARQREDLYWFNNEMIKLTKPQLELVIILLENLLYDL